MTHGWIANVGLVLSFVAMAYTIILCLNKRTFVRGPRETVQTFPPVTILKPLCGAEHETYKCLRSVCDQDYPEFDVIFGICESNDPVLHVARRLQREFPARHVKIVVEHRQHGSNRKVSNLLNMMPYVNNGIVVLSDSDVQVQPDYLRRVVAPLSDDTVGIVTCAYRGRPAGGLWSVLGALFINEWFLPSVGVAAAAGSRSFAFGATIAMRREVLAGVGGFRAIANQLADDYRLGELTRRLGLRTVLSDLIVETIVTERSLKDLVLHELRWLRTIRALKPFSYSLCFITFGIPVAALGMLLAGGATPSVKMFALTIAARAVLHFKMSPIGRNAASLWIVPARDIMSLCLWFWSFTTRRVQWRDDHYRVLPDGSVQLVARI